jgi:hypothetical protein
MMIQSAPLRLAVMAWSWGRLNSGLKLFFQEIAWAQSLARQSTTSGSDDSKVGAAWQIQPQHQKDYNGPHPRPLYPLRHLDEFGNCATDARKDLVRLG